MKKLHKKYVTFTIILSFLFFVTFLALVYIIDPAGLNNRFDLKLVKNSELAARTQKFIELNTVKPNTIMLGGSRVHFMNTNDVKKYTNDKVYNIGLTSSTLEEQYDFLKYSLENFPVKNVIMGLNLYTFSDKLQTNNSDYDRNIFNEGFAFKQQLKHYTEVPLFVYLKDNCIHQYKKSLYKNGSRTAYNQMQYIGDAPWSKRANASNGQYMATYSNYLDYKTKSQLKIFKKMVKLCKDKNINLYIFTTAIHKSQLQILQDLNKMDIYYKWKKDIAQIAPYYDFMYANSVTKNSNNYIDPSHVRQEKGYLYFSRIFNDKSVQVPFDFGVLVTKDNIEKHIKYLHNQNLHL